MFLREIVLLCPTCTLVQPSRGQAVTPYANDKDGLPRCDVNDAPSGIAQRWADDNPNAASAIPLTTLPPAEPSMPLSVFFSRLSPASGTRSPARPRSDDDANPTSMSTVTGSYEKRGSWVTHRCSRAMVRSRELQPAHTGGTMTIRPSRF